MSILQKQTSIHTFCERTLLILTQLYSYINFQSNYICIYVIIFLYYIKSLITTAGVSPTCNQCSSSIETSGLTCNVISSLCSEDIPQSLVGFYECGTLSANGYVLTYSSWIFNICMHYPIMANVTHAQ